MKRFLMVLQERCGYPEKPSRDLQQPEVVMVVRLDDHLAEVERLRAALMNARELMVHMRPGAQAVIDDALAYQPD